MNLVATLWQLQTLDQEIDDKTQRMNQVAESLASDPAVASARATQEVEQKKLAQVRGALHDRELEAKGLDAKLKELNQRLYSGNVVNPKELDGLSKDLEMHKRQRSALDDQLLELMEQVEQAQARVNTQADALKQLESKRAGDLTTLTRDHETLATRLAHLKTDRAQTQAMLAGDGLRIYDQLRRTKAGRAVVQLRRDSCGACGVTVPTGLVNRVRTGDEIVYCTSCGRILVA
jgi:predicted  nucleic acid-binding Zn-ribbon protein